MSIRHDNINSHIVNHPDFEGVMKSLAEMYSTCPDTSHLRFRQALEDQMKVNIQSRGRVATGSAGGSTWRDEQKSAFAGRGQKGIKLTGSLLGLLKNQLAFFEEADEDVSTYRSLIEKAGYGWVRYSGPRGSAEARSLAFEVRINGSKIDHPKHLFKVSEIDWNNFHEDRSPLGGTPFSLNLEVAAS